MSYSKSSHKTALCISAFKVKGYKTQFDLKKKKTVTKETTDS